MDVVGNTVAGNDNSGISCSGTTTGAIRANVIAGNAAAAGSGIQVSENCVVRITANQMPGNGGLGVNLIGGTEDGARVTGNDAGDGDSGPNQLQNFPVITSALRQSNGGTTITGQLNSTASTTFRIELFFVTGAIDPSGNGEAVALLVAQEVTTNASGNSSFSFPVAGLQAGHAVTMTAINTSTGATSEFSENAFIVQI
jgi:hypothetical protein